MPGMYRCILIFVPLRLTPLITNEVYHIFNRSIAKQPIFKNQIDRQRACDLINFYRFPSPQIRFSHYHRLDADKKKEFLSRLKNQMPQIEIYSFSLMPNHFHFLLKQSKENGIVSFMKLFQESYAKYLNIKTERTGSVFQSKFKSVRIETEEQLLHVSRYIHLNPVASMIIKDINELGQCQWNSYIDYLSTPVTHEFIQTKFLSKIIGSNDKLQEFTSSQVDYQRHLQGIKHLILE